MVIVIMMLASFLALQLVMQVRAEMKIAHNTKMRARGRFLAEAGISLALFRLEENNGILPIEGPNGEEMERFAHGRIYDTIFSYGKIEYYAVDEGGKININGDRIEPLMELFLQYHGLEEEEITILLDSLMDWRDANHLHRQNGAERDYYEGLEEPYTPRNNDLADPAEFFLIRGTEKLRGKFDPAEVFTVQKRANQVKISIRELTPAMLDFICNGDEEKKALYYQKLEEETNFSMAHFREVIGEERYVLLQPYIDMSMTRTYYIAAKGYVGSRQESEETVVEEEVSGEESQSTQKKAKPGTLIKVLLKKQGANYVYLSWAEQLI